MPATKQRTRRSAAAMRARCRRKRFKRAVFLALLVCVFLIGRKIILSRFAAGEKTQPYEKGEAPWCIALDAGHGGADCGAQGFVSEAEMNEQTVRALSQLLENDDNFNVVLCREWNETVEKPSVRAITGNKAGADLLISIHGNYADTETAYGFECFPITPGHTYAEPSYELAQCISTAFQNAGASLRGANGIRYVYYEGVNGEEKVFREAYDTTVYPSQTFGFLEYAENPAVLIEQCFITNQSDVDMFGSEIGTQRAAECIYRAICAYYGVEPKLY